MATQTQPEGHLLVRTIAAVLDKTAEPEQLRAVLEASKAGLTEQIQDFHATIEGLDAEVREQSVALVDGVDEVFGYMETALGEVAQFLETGDENLLYNSGSVIRRGTDQLNFLFNELRNYVLAISGPTPIPNLNLLIRAYEVFTPDKDAKGERLKEMIHSERIVAIDSLDQLDGLNGDQLTPELEALKGVWDQHLRCMNRMYQAVEKGDQAAVDAELENAKTSFSRLFEQMPIATTSQRLQGDTPSASVNLVLNLTDDLTTQALSDAPLAEALEGVYAEAKDTHTQLEAVRSAGAESVMLGEELDRALQAVELQLEALGEYNEFFENREVLVLASAKQKLKDSAIALSASLDQLAELAERENKVVCIRCGHYNPKGRSNCEKCVAPLPNLGNQEVSTTFETGEGSEAQVAPQGPVLTANTVRIYEAVNAVFDGTMDNDQFMAEVDWFQGLIDQNSEFEVDDPDLDAMNDDERNQAEEALKVLDEVQDLFAQGVTEMLEALECFRRYPESGLRSDLEDGIKLMDQGARKVETVRGASRTKQDA